MKSEIMTFGISVPITMPMSKFTNGLLNLRNKEVNKERKVKNLLKITIEKN